jgi:geranylgeranyl pyrophosphate synthase
MAGPVSQYRQSIARYTRHLGVAYQILNDLNDWQPKDENKQTAGRDVFDGRPTILLALALEHLDRSACKELLAVLGDPSAGAEALGAVDRLYRQAGVYDMARVLIDKYHARAREVADAMDPDSLRRLLHYLADTLLE